MGQSHANILVHIVFSTKDRHAAFQNRELRADMHAFLGKTSNQLECPAVQVGGIADHIHLLGRQARTISVADWVKELKRVSSLWVKEQCQELQDFHWQAGYGAFSVSQSLSPTVIHYIREQETHHRVMTYQDEVRLLLQKHEIEYDERYVWD